MQDKSKCQKFDKVNVNPVFRGKYMCIYTYSPTTGIYLLYTNQKSDLAPTSWQMVWKF